MKQLNPSIKHHTLIGALLSVWIFLFAFFVRPFEHGNMDFQIWMAVSIGFSLMAFLCYGVITLLQRFVYSRTSKWNVGLEILCLVVFFLLYLVGTYLYYKGSLVRGNYSFYEFFHKIIIRIALILTPVMVLARRYSIKLIPAKGDDITIKGENKLDILKIKQSDLICISNSQNYVEIFFLEKDELRSKLIRASLKKIQDEFDFLIKVHRSHLINPSHFKSWKDPSTISLTQIELPVSKNYKERILSL